MQFIGSFGAAAWIVIALIVVIILAFFVVAAIVTKPQPKTDTVARDEPLVPMIPLHSAIHFGRGPNFVQVDLANKPSVEVGTVDGKFGATLD